MYSETSKRKGHTAAWRISWWATLAFAIGSLIVFLFLQRFASHEIQRRTDAWLTGEVETLGDVAVRTPKNDIYDRIVDEVAELATKEVPQELQAGGDPNQEVFFIETGPDNRVKLWVGKGNGEPFQSAISQHPIPPGRPVDLRISGFLYPYRVVSLPTPTGDRIHLGLSEAHDIHVLRRMRIRLISLCSGIVVLGFGVVFMATKRMLDRVHRITATANRIGQNDLRSRVPEVRGNDEIAQLARTLNRMLDRIENSVNQLHTITDSLAHDLRSPMTAIRSRLEIALLSGHDDEAGADSIASALEELDRLSDFLTKSLDVAEANADALHLRRTPIDIDELTRTMVDLYEPSLSERGLKVSIRSQSSLMVSADPGLLHRMMANLLDNTVKHLPAGTNLRVNLLPASGMARIEFEDNGPGFPPDVVDHPFEKYAKGKESTGSGLGLAFVEAVVRAHGGQIRAFNGKNGGAHIVIELPQAEGIAKGTVPETAQAHAAD